MAVMVEVLCVLAIATKEVKENRASESSKSDRSTVSAQYFAEMFLKKLVGRTDMEDALQRLENVTLEESRMTGAEALKAIHDVGNKVGDNTDKMRDALQAVHDRVGGVEGMLQGVTEMLQGGGDKVQGVDDRVNSVKDIGDKVINGAQTVRLAKSTTHCLHG